MSVRLSGRQFFWSGLCSALILLNACGSGQDPEVALGNEAPGIGIRTPHPTFTPTARAAALVPTVVLALTPTNTVIVPPTATATPLVAAPTAVPPTATPLPTATSAPPAKPFLVINSSDVNIRAGPGTEYDILVVADRGQEYEVVGKNAAGDWWQICCIEGEMGWVISEFADTDGPVDQVAIVGEDAPTPATGGGEQATAATIAAPVTPTVAAPVFDLVVQEQFPENKLVRIFLYVYEKDVGLEGYSLRVTRDGAELRIKETSFGGSPGLTWPVADVRQRSQNLKIEFPGIAPAGQWIVQLTQNGTPVGPAATFTLTANDPNLELYVRYQKRQ